MMTFRTEVGADDDDSSISGRILAEDLLFPSLSLYRMKGGWGIINFPVILHPKPESIILKHLYIGEFLLVIRSSLFNSQSRLVGG